MTKVDWVDVNDKLPHDFWLERFRKLFKDENEAIKVMKSTIDDFLVTVVTDDPNDDPEVTIADYTLSHGWMYCIDNKFKYDGNPWRVTHWAIKPKPAIT